MKAITDEFHKWAARPEASVEELGISEIPNLFSLAKATGVSSYPETLQKWLDLSKTSVGVQYVLVLAYTTYGHLVTIKKTRPSWQYGRVNTPGGQIFDNEGWFEAATRTFKTETGVEYRKWDLLGIMEGSCEEGGFRVWCVTATDDIFFTSKTQTDEEVQVVGSGAVMGPGYPGTIVEGVRTIAAFRAEFKDKTRPFLILRYP